MIAKLPFPPSPLDDSDHRKLTPSKNIFCKPWGIDITFHLMLHQHNGNHQYLATRLKLLNEESDVIIIYHDKKQIKTYSLLIN